MAKLAGGIFSRPSGKTAEIVFGAARTRTGKVVTARQFVSPSNPDTAAQQTQRNIFSDSLAIVRYIGPTVYQGYFNRAVSQLPGFQSLMSIMMNNMSDAGALTAPSDTNLGTLHFPETFDFYAGSASGVITLELSDETGDNGTDSDKVGLIFVPAARADRDPIPTITVVTAGQRDSITVDQGGLQAGKDYLCGGWMIGQGTAEGLLSLVRWEVTAAKA